MFAPQARVDDATVTMLRTDAGLFAWRGSGIMLLGETDGDRWIVARGWLGQDKLTDVRRWSFASPASFAGQVRRLAMEATGDSGEATAAGAAAARWAGSLV